MTRLVQLDDDRWVDPARVVAVLRTTAASTRYGSLPTEWGTQLLLDSNWTVETRTSPEKVLALLGATGEEPS